MKILYLLRHAEAESKISKEDHNRALTENGESQARSLSKRLNGTKNLFDKILCSSSRRTKKTCSILLEELDISIKPQIKQSLYNPSIEDFLANIEQLEDNINSVLIVSHNPAISDFYNFLSSSLGQLIYFSPCNMVKLTLNIDSWEEIGQNCAIEIQRL